MASTVTNRYTLGAIKCAGTTGLNLFQVGQRGINPGIGVLENHASGEPARGMAAVGEIMPVVSFVTKEINRALGAINALLGLAIPDLVDGATYTNAVVYMVKKLQQAARATTYASMTYAKGMFIPKTLTAEHGKEAELQVDFYPLSSDGKADPGTWDGAASPPTFGSDVMQKYTLASTLIGSTDVDYVTRVVFDFGLSVSRRGAGSGPFPVNINIDAQNPTITVTSGDHGALNTYKQYGLIQPATASKFWLAQMAPENVGNVTRTADPTALHLLFQVNSSQGLIVPEEFQGSGENDDAMGTVKIYPVKKSSALWTVTPSIAIT